MGPMRPIPRYVVWGLKVTSDGLIFGDHRRHKPAPSPLNQLRNGPKDPLTGQRLKNACDWEAMLN